LLKNFVKTGGLLLVSLDGRVGFNMHFATKLAHLKFSPETFAKTAITEFSFTQFDREQQILNLVILREKENL
jgi:dynein heavy chain